MEFFHENADFSSWLGLLISVVGAFISLWTLRTAKDIQTRFLRRTQIPHLIESLETDLRDLNALLLTQSLDENRVKRLIRKSSITIESAHQKVKSPETQKALRVAKKMLKMRAAISKNEAETFYTELIAVHHELNLIRNDDEWSALL